VFHNASQDFSSQQMTKESGRVSAKRASKLFVQKEFSLALHNGLTKHLYKYENTIDQIEDDKLETEKTPKKST